MASVWQDHGHYYNQLALNGDGSFDRRASLKKALGSWQWEEKFWFFANTEIRVNLVKRIMSGPPDTPDMFAEMEVKKKAKAKKRARQAGW
jgi:hypothetical protein